MRSLLVVALTIVGLSSSAYAETFLCQGTGRFAQIGNQTVKLVWKKEYQKVLMETASVKVQVNVDKSNSDGTAYLGIEVLDVATSGVVAIRGAKGSLKDMVDYMDSATSQVLCLPLAE